MNKDTMPGTYEVIETHKGNVLNDSIYIEGQDKSPGGANTYYAIIVQNALQHKLYAVEMRFQNGNPNNEINGISNEALLAVLIDRLSSFQSGKFACAENQVALDGCLAAMCALKTRTAIRESKGIEGTQEV